MLLLVVLALGMGETLEWRIGGVQRIGLSIIKPAGGDRLVAGRVIAGSWDLVGLYAVWGHHILQRITQIQSQRHAKKFPKKIVWRLY